MSSNEVISKFLNSWFFVVLVIALVFIFITKASWKRVVSKISLQELVNLYYKWKSKFRKQEEHLPKGDQKKLKKFFSDIKAGSFDDFHEKLTSYVEVSEKTKLSYSNLEERNKELVNFAKYYFFSYLGIFLLNHTKEALVWFYNHKFITKDYFFNQTFINPILNLKSEKEVIFTLFLQHFLITKNSQDLFYVTPLGVELLQFSKLIE